MAYWVYRSLQEYLMNEDRDPNHFNRCECLRYSVSTFLDRFDFGRYPFFSQRKYGKTCLNDGHRSEE